MIEYPKISTIYTRDLSIKGAPVVVGSYTQPEFAYLAGNTWQFTEKVDGTNIRVAWDGSHRSYGGRTDNAQMPTSLFALLERLFSDDQKFRDHFGIGSVILFGEGYGAGIQKAGASYGQVVFVLFDVLIGTWWLRRPDVEGVASTFGVEVVPVVGEGTLQQATELTRTGFRSHWGGFTAEGLVLRPKVELFTR